jgi:hypothetical protein
MLEAEFYFDLTAHIHSPPRSCALGWYPQQGFLMQYESQTRAYAHGRT